jgi:hypothetical protein
MSRRSWDDPWRRYEASVPLPADGGIATSKQRGAMAGTWWSQRFVRVLESYGLGARMQRGRRYARQGQVLSLEVRPGVLAAQVQGSRRTPYLVTVTVQEPTKRQWQAIDAAAKVGFVAHLLAGEVPNELEEVFRSAGVELFPGSYGDLRAHCSCPDWENPCKHLAAVLYVFADQLDADPWLVLAWRGRTREDVLGHLDAEAAEPVAPWWPFAPGPLPDLPDRHDDPVTPDPPDAVLDTLEPLDVAVRDVPFVELLRPVYAAIVAAAADEPS